MRTWSYSMSTQLGSLTNNIQEPLCYYPKRTLSPFSPNTQLQPTVSLRAWTWSRQRSPHLLWRLESQINIRKKEGEEESHFKSLQIDEPGHCFRPCAHSARSWLGSGLESTQAELVHCNWMLRAGGNCSHLPAPDVWSPFLWYCYAALILFPFFPAFSLNADVIFQ